LIILLAAPETKSSQGKDIDEGPSFGRQPDGGDQMKTTHQPVTTFAEHLQTPRGYGGLSGKPASRRLMVIACLHCKGSGRHRTCPGDDPGGNEAFGFFPGRVSTRPCLVERARSFDTILKGRITALGLKLSAGLRSERR